MNALTDRFPAAPPPPPSHLPTHVEYDARVNAGIATTRSWTTADGADPDQKLRPRRRRGVVLLSPAAAASVLLLAATLAIAAWMLLRRLALDEPGSDSGDDTDWPPAAFCQRVRCARPAQPCP